MACSTSDAAKSQSPMSPGTPTASPPAATISAATDSAASPMSLTTTLAPAAPSASASARPRPTPAPVTTATPPSSSDPVNDGTNGFTTCDVLSRKCSESAEHERRRRYAGATGDEHVLGVVDLVDRGAA